jgi:drug/metabolite transporter superfamily protein YnfA
MVMVSLRHDRFVDGRECIYDWYSNMVIVMGVNSVIVSDMCQVRATIV